MQPRSKIFNPPISLFIMCLSARKEAWLNLYTARSIREMNCWHGGDAGHQKAMADAITHASECTNLLK